jgi:hypothetical protein
MVLWWTGDPRAHEALFRDLADECSRLVLDLPDPGAAAGALRLGLDPAVCHFSRDVAWFGLTRWRELIAQFFDPPCAAGSLGSIDAVQIEALTPEAARVPRVAIWLAAWLAGQLGWTPQGQPRRVSNPAEATLQADFLGPAGPVMVLIVTHAFPTLPPVPEVMGVTITAKGSAGSEVFRLARPKPDSPAVLIKAETDHLCRLPRLVEAPELDPALRVAAALESSRNDPPFQKALSIALWLLEADG